MQRFTPWMLVVLLCACNPDPTASRPSKEKPTSAPADAERPVAADRPAVPSPVARRIRGEGRTADDAILLAELTITADNRVSGLLTVGNRTLQAKGSRVDKSLRCWLSGTDDSGATWRGILFAESTDGWGGSVVLSDDGASSVVTGSWKETR
jgi:hypothetical protein